MTSHLRHLTPIILGLLSTAIAVRKFELLLIDVQCITNPNYLVNVSCTLNKSQPEKVRMNIYSTLRKEVRDMRLELSVDLVRSAGDKITFFKVSNVDFCSFLQANTTMPMLKMYRDVLRKYGTWPKQCPLELGYPYKFEEVTLDANYLPAFVPNSDFIVNIVFSDGKVKFWDFKLFGKISHKRKNKNATTDRSGVSLVERFLK